MPLQRVPATEDLEASTDHHLACVEGRLRLVDNVQRRVVEGDTAADPPIGLEEASVSLEMTLEVGHAAIALDIVAASVRALPATGGAIDHVLDRDVGRRLDVARLGASQDRVLRGRHAGIAETRASGGRRDIGRL